MPATGRDKPVGLGFAKDYHVVYHLECRYQLGSRPGVEHGPWRVFVRGDEDKEFLGFLFFLSESAAVLAAQYVEGASSNEKARMIMSGEALDRLRGI